MREREEKSREGGSEESGDNLSGEKRQRTYTRTRTLRGGPVLRVSPTRTCGCSRRGPGPGNLTPMALFPPSPSPVHLVRPPWSVRSFVRSHPHVPN